MAGLRENAVAYLRVSGKGQIDGHGFERQRGNILDYAKRNNVEVVGWFEEAYTGTKADRPVFAEMLAEVLNNGVRVILVESMDRFARDLGVQIALLAKLRSEGIALISATTGEDVTASLDEDPMKEAMVLIQGVFAQAEKKRLVLKLRGARAAKRAKGGRCEGAKPFGQTEEERRIIATIKKLRRKPKGGRARSYRVVAEILNANGVPARRGGKWYASTVRGVCLSDAYRHARVGDALDVAATGHQGAA